jgi:hypothetical protein
MLCKWKWRRKEITVVRAIVVIGSLCPVSVKGYYEGQRWGRSPKGCKALSFHHIWTFIPDIRRATLGKNVPNGCKDVHTYRMNIHM